MKKHSPQALTTPAVDLAESTDRFDTAFRLHGRLHRWRHLVGSYWWIIMLIVPLVVVPVFYITTHNPPTYESKARMWLTGKMDFREGRLYTEELIDYLGTQAELLRSTRIQRQALDRMEDSAALDALRDRPDWRDQIRALGERWFGWRSATNGAAAGGFPFQVKVEESSESSILELRAIGPEPSVTQSFLNHLMEAYLSFKRGAREQTSDRTMTSVAAQADQLEKDLEAQQEKLHTFQSSNNIVFLQEQGNSAGSYLSVLNRRLANLRNELRLISMLQPEQWVESQTAPDTVTLGEPPVKNESSEEMASNLAAPQHSLFKASQQIQLLEAQREELSKFLRPMHPKIKKLNEEIETQRQMAEIARNEAEKQMALRRQNLELEIQSLEAASAEWDTKALETSRKMADYDRIRQDLQRLQTAYDKMVGLIQTMDVSKTVEQENMGILEPASPAKPVGNLPRNLAIALAGSLFMGFGLIYGLGMLRDDFSSLAEMRDHLAEPVVGQIPAIVIKKSRGKLRNAIAKQRYDFLEAFRNIRSSLLFMDHDGERPRTIVVASSVPDEGKSTVALYLSATLAMGGAHVLLIDGDMRRGALHSYVGAVRRPGLAEILNRDCSPANAIVPTGMDNLDLLPAGFARRNPGELVLSPEWNRLLAEAREQYDYIIVDTPPILATNDAASLAPRVDGALFVVRRSFTSARMARTALNVLRQRHVEVLGLIFNHAISSHSSHHFYGRYRQAYGWDTNPNEGVGVLADKATPRTHEG